MLELVRTTGPMTAVLRGPIPMYLQLHRSLRQRIEAGEWTSGERIPTERELCARYSLSRATVREALDGLVSDGLIERRQGSGSFVRARRVEQSLGRLYSFTAEMLARGRRPGLRVIEKARLPASAAAAERLGIEQGEELYWLVRLRLLDDEPLMLERSYLPARYCPGLIEQDLAGRLLHDVFAERYGRPFARQRKWVEPVLIDDASAALLGVRAGVPALRIERLTYSPDDEPLELREILVRGDRCRYFIEVSRP